MNNPRLATRYAKSLLDLASEQNTVAETWDNVQFLQRICKSNLDFVAMLQSPVITADKKSKVITAITTGSINILTGLFIKLLIEKKRESNLPEILKAFEEQYNKMHNIHVVKFTSAQPVGEEVQTAIKEKIKQQKNIENIQWIAAIDESLIGGFKLQIGDLLVDASISHDLKDIKRQFANNDYMHKMR